MHKETLLLDSAWHFKEFPESARRMRDLDSGDWQNATVPSSIYTCLQQAGVILIPKLNSQLEDLTWIDHKNWVFRKEFDVPPSLLNKEQIEIIFNGLDTVTQIWLNEKLLGKTENMFISHRFDIKPYLKQSGNLLTIKFISALQHADRLQKRHGKLNEIYMRDPRCVYVRKAAYQFGCDFHGIMTGCGIFQDIQIEGHNIAKIDNLHLRTIDCNQYTADIRVAVELDRINHANPLICKILITGGGLELEQQLLLESDNSTASTILHIERPFLWWPLGYGIPHLYHFRVELQTKDGQLLDAKDQNFGIRTIHFENNNEKTECIVNGQPISLKGIDWTPPSLFPGPETHYESLLKKAKECHINILRVWAGGYYENSLFYELCDRMGILVWQDFMFDSAYYPDRQWFLDTVKEEAESVIKRLRNYACIALWCGNNEIDFLHKNGKLGKGRKFYGKTIFHKLLPQLINELDPDRHYVPTFSKEDTTALTQYIPDVPSPPGVNTLPIETYNKNPFKMLEELSGSPLALEKIAQSQPTEFIPPRGLQEYIWQSQVTQARIARSVIEKIRSSAHPTNCMLGRLNTPCLSINSGMFDSSRQPKALFYYARRFLAPLLVTLMPEDKTGVLKAVAVNDSASPVTGVLSCRMIAANGKILDATEIPLRISPFSKTAPINLPKSLTTPSDPRQAFLSVRIKYDDALLADKMHFFCPDMHFQWPIANIDLQISPNDHENAWDVTLTSEVPVRDLQILPPQPADISDNFLTLLPNEQKKIRILYYNSPTPSIRIPLELYSANRSCRAEQS